MSVYDQEADRGSGRLHEVNATDAERRRIYETRPERFSAHGLQALHEIDSADMINRHLRYVDHVVQHGKYRKNTGHEEESTVALFGMLPPESKAIRYTAMQSLGLPVRFKGTGSTYHPQEYHRYSVVPSEKLWFVLAPQHAEASIRALDEEALRHPEGGIIVSGLGAVHRPVLSARDIESPLVPASTEYQTMISRLFLTQQVLHQESSQAMSRAAHNEEVILSGGNIDSEINYEPLYSLEDAYTYFRCRTEQELRPYTMEEMEELQVGIYQNILDADSGLGRRLPYREASPSPNGTAPFTD